MRARFHIPKQFLALARLDLVELHINQKEGEFGVKCGSRVLFNVKNGALNRYCVISVGGLPGWPQWKWFIGDLTRKKLIETGNISKAILKLLEGREEDF